MTPAASVPSARNCLVTTSLQRRENWDARKLFVSSCACGIAFSVGTPLRMIKTRHSPTALSHDNDAPRLLKRPASSGAHKEVNSWEMGWISGPCSFRSRPSTGGGRAVGRIYNAHFQAKFKTCKINCTDEGIPANTTNTNG